MCWCFINFDVSFRSLSFILLLDKSSDSVIKLLCSSSFVHFFVSIISVFPLSWILPLEIPKCRQVRTLSVRTLGFLQYFSQKFFTSYMYLPNFNILTPSVSQKSKFWPFFTLATTNSNKFQKFASSIFEIGLVSPTID